MCLFRAQAKPWTHGRSLPPNNRTTGRQKESLGLRDGKGGQMENRKLQGSNSLAPGLVPGSRPIRH